MSVPSDKMVELSDLRAANLHLQATINGLREGLEAEAAKTVTAVQAGKAEMADEIAQLRLTIGSLRTRLETEASGHAASLQALRAALQGETVQLKATINTLRAELEAARHASTEALASQQAASAREQDALKNQIKALRTLLETNGLTFKRLSHLRGLVGCVRTRRFVGHRSCWKSRSGAPH